MNARPLYVPVPVFHDCPRCGTLTFHEAVADGDTILCLGCRVYFTARFPDRRSSLGEQSQGKP